MIDAKGLRRIIKTREWLASLTWAKRANGAWGARYSYVSFQFQNRSVALGASFVRRLRALFLRGATAAQKMRFSRCTGPPCSCISCVAGEKRSLRERVSLAASPLSSPSVANPQLASRARFATRPPFFWILSSFGLLRNFFSFFLLLITHFSPQLISICEW